MPNWKKVIVSGSDAVLSNITASGGITGSIIRAPQIIGSVQVGAPTIAATTSVATNLIEEETANGGIEISANLTASGNISASGQIAASSFLIDEVAGFANNNGAFQLDAGGVFTAYEYGRQNQTKNHSFGGNITASNGGNISASGFLQGTIIKTDNGTNLLGGKRLIVDADGYEFRDGRLLVGNLTSSGNISASGISTGSLGRVEADSFSKTIVTSHHNMSLDGGSATVDYYIPINSLADGSNSSLYYTRILPAYNGRVLKILFRPSVAMGSSCIIYMSRRAHDGTSVSHQTSGFQASETFDGSALSTVIVPCAQGGANAANWVFEEGDQLGFSLVKDTTDTTIDLTMTVVYEYDII